MIKLYSKATAHILVKGEGKVKGNTEYGVISSVKDEKLLHTRLNEYLVDHHRVFAKTKSKSLLDSYLPFVYKHFYFNLNKGMGVYTALYPNQDMKGKYRYPKEKRAAWILTVLIHKNLPGYEKEE